MKYLFLFTVSPVQSFIAEARKTRDLFTASSILSDLINSAVKILPENAELIFPTKGNNSAPNRFLCIIKDLNASELKELGEKLKTHIKEEFLKIAVKSLELAECKNKPSGFDQQIDDYLQISYAALPYTDNYEKEYIDLESLLGTVKGCKSFNQLAEQGRKCSICGQRNALFYSTEKGLINQQDGAIKINDSGIDLGEGLCAVCFTKRFYNKDKKFPSTSKIALMSALNKAKVDDSFKEIYNGYKDLFKNLSKIDFDHQFLFEENLTEKYFLGQNNPIDKKTLNNAKKRLQDINEKFKKKNIKAPKYYAMIMFDGDSMGKWLSGTNLKDKSKLEEFHKALSTQLGLFADEVKRILIEPKGKVVYAGGEDFLGFVNLDYLFEIMQKMYLLFNEIVNNKLAEFKEDETLTFSAGIIIVHYKMPFNAVLNKLRKAEKFAKQIDEKKNAFAISVIKHSGETNHLIFKWGNKTDIVQNVKHIEILVKYLVNNIFSNTFIKRFEAEFKPLLVEDRIESYLIKPELKRLISNSCISKNITKEEKKLEVDKLYDALLNLYNSSSTNNFIEALNISEFLSRYINEVQ